MQGVELQEVAVVSKMETTEIHRFMWVILKFKQNLPKGWKATGARLLPHPSWAGWNFTNFGKVRSIDPNSIGDNGLGQ